MTAKELLEVPVQVVAGKGGVGRTTVAAALALRASRAGHRTLLLEVDAPDSAARALGVKPAPDAPREVENNLWLCRMTPAGAMREYALLILRFRLLYRLVFENDVVKYLLRSIPSLPEVTMLGKTWWHATQEKRSGGGPRFDRVIVDAPATGHAITFLSVARTVADVAPKGIMKDRATDMAEMVEGAVMHVVAVPEEMPVNEGLELFHAIPERVRIRRGLAILNRRSPPLLAEGERALLAELRRDTRLEPYLDAAERRLEREALEAGHAQRFFEGTGQPGLVVPDVLLFGGRVGRPRAEPGPRGASFEREGGASVEPGPALSAARSLGAPVGAGLVEEVARAFDRALASEADEARSRPRGATA